MSSYFKANRDYQKIQQSRGIISEEEIVKMAFGEQGHVIRYPENVNMREFIEYMVYPTLTY